MIEICSVGEQGGAPGIMQSGMGQCKFHLHSVLWFHNALSSKILTGICLMHLPFWVGSYWVSKFREKNELKRSQIGDTCKWIVDHKGQIWTTGKIMPFSGGIISSDPIWVWSLSTLITNSLTDIFSDSLDAAGNLAIAWQQRLATYWNCLATAWADHFGKSTQFSGPLWLYRCLNLLLTATSKNCIEAASYLIACCVKIF